MSELPDGAYALALAGLPGIGPVSLGRLLAEATPPAAWAQVLDGAVVRPSPRPLGPGRERPLWTDSGGAGAASAAGGHDGASGGTRRAWDVAARRTDVAAAWASAERAGIGVTWPGEASYPTALADDPLPPAVLFWRGDLRTLDRPCVAIVGTRHCTPDGREIAAELGHDLAMAGVCVLSGLALGVDAGAHRGALRSGRSLAVAGIAASGVDRPYPRRHAGLWEDVVRAGAVLSETAPGAPAQAWRFPARNRIIAGLAQLVVVVESHAGGGSMITVEAAIDRGVEVRAVPGSVRSPASAGTNQLLYDGCGPVRHAQDVLDALGLFLSSGSSPAPSRRPRSSPVAPPGAATKPAVDGVTALPAAGVRGAPARPAGPDDVAVLDAVGPRPTSLNRVVERSGLAVITVAAALDRLAGQGLVGEEDGWWRRRS